MKNESQYGLLLLQQYLYEHTDDQHPVSVADILAFWREHGIQAGRKSVYSAIEVLQSSGMDIVCVKSTQNRYFVGERLFELPELKLLVDAVESSRFITAKKSERLIEKLGKLTSESHARQLDRHIYMDGTAKPENECIYYSVDEIHNAIQEKRQITFQYYEYTPQKEKILKHNGYRYQFSPYALIWSRDCYYAVGWSEKHGKLAQFRVDRMVAVESSDQAAVCKPDFDPAEYVRKIFGMYPDDLCTVELLCENEVMRSVIDRFGEEVSTVTADDGHFKAIVEVAPSPPFFAWVFTFCGKIQILGPAEVLDEMRGLTLRGMAAKLDLSPVYMSNIENDRRAAPSQEYLERMAMLLQLDKPEREWLLDLAAKSKQNRVSADLPDYIMDREIVRAALRTAREADATDQEWQDFIDRINRRMRSSGEDSDTKA